MLYIVYGQSVSQDSFYIATYYFSTENLSKRWHAEMKLLFHYLNS